MAITPYLLISCQMREIAIHRRVFLDNKQACRGKKKARSQMLRAWGCVL